MPEITTPKTPCLPFRCGVGPKVMKNWEPLVLGPAFAIDRIPGWSCLRARAPGSSANLYPGPPIPVPVGSPLGHEIANDAVESCSVVIAFACQKHEVVDGLGSLGCKQLYVEISDFRVECCKVLLRGINYHRRWTAIAILCFE